MPKLVTDPVASFRPWPVNIRVGQHTVTIPATCAADWLDLLMDVENLDMEKVFPGLLGEAEQEIVEDALLHEKITVKDLLDTGLDIIAAAAGRPWWVALKLVATVRTNWDAIGGEFAMRGVDPVRLSLAGWLDAAQTIIIRGIDGNDKINVFLMRLEQPPPGVEAEAQAMDANTFMSMM